MASSEKLRSALWASRDWATCLRDLAGQLEARPLTASVVEPAVMLARAFEAIEPDRAFAVRMYFLAWNAQPTHGALLGRAIALCREIGDLERAAKLASLGYQQSGDPKAALIEGLAWLDANRPADAVQPLSAARQLMPSDEALGLLLATAKQDWDDPRPHVRGLIAQARSSKGPAAAGRYACAARIVRNCGFEGDDYGGLLQKSFTSDPSDDSVFGLLENWLVGRGDRERLIQVYRVRAESTHSPAELCDEYRRAGTKLVTSDVLRGLGLRLLERSVSHGYEHGLRTIPGHIATLSLIRNYAAAAELDDKFLALLARGLDQALATYDRLWMAVSGLAVASRLGSHDTAQAYAAIVAEIAPESPVLQDYCVGTGLAEERWAIEEEAVSLDTWALSGSHVAYDTWQPNKKIGLAAAIVEEEAPPAIAPEPVPAPVQEQVWAAAPEQAPTRTPEPVPAPPAFQVELAPPVVTGLHEPEPDPGAQTSPAPPIATVAPTLPDEPLLDLAPLEAEAPAEAAPPPVVPEPAAPTKPLSIIPSSAMRALAKHTGGSLEVDKPRPANPTKRARRMAIPADVRVVSADGVRENLVAITRDLSASGLFLVTGAELTIGSTVRIELELPGGDDFEIQAVSLEARVVRRADNGYGVEFVAPPADVVARIRAM